jgi:hypothetical protein
VFSVKFDIKSVNKLCDSLKKELKSVKGAKAGILENKRYPAEDGKEGITLVENALIQEYGATIHVTDKMRAWFRHQGFPLRKDKTTIVIPPRPFLRTALKKQNEWVRFVNEYFDADMSGGMTLKQIAGTVGGLIEKAIKEAILSNIPPENSAFTIMKKGSSGTLRDTGTLVQSIHSEVITNDRT